MIIRPIRLAPGLVSSLLPRLIVIIAITVTAALLPVSDWSDTASADPVITFTSMASGEPIDTPRHIVMGPDGNMWFTNYFGNSIVRLTSDGTTTAFTDASIAHPDAITFGPDGNLWFTNNNSIGRITTSGIVSFFTDPSVAHPSGITTGIDGNLWFTNYTSNSIGRITTSGAISIFTDPSIVHPCGITTAVDGNLWFTNCDGASIGRITTSGTVSSFTNPGISKPSDITSGPDGNLWFTDDASSAIGRITTAGVVSIFADPSIADPWKITTGSDGNLWFTNRLTNSIGRITTAGVISTFDDPSISQPQGIATGPHGNLWFTNRGNNSVVRINLDIADVAGAFNPMTPVRIIDSRPSSQVGPFSTPWTSGQTRDITISGPGVVPSEASAVVLNVTGVTPSAETFLTLWPKGATRPTASNLNLVPGDIRPNLVMAKIGLDGAVSLYNNVGTTDVVIDVVGWYGPGFSSSYFNELSPARIWDTRPAPENVGPLGKLGQGETKNLHVTQVGGVPANAAAVVMNVTAVNPSYSTYVTAWPTGTPKPTASNLNAPAGAVRPNLVVARVGSGGQVSFFNNAGDTDLVVDVVGYFASSGSQFNGMTPKRIWDTRPAPENVGPLGKLSQGQAKSIQVAGLNGVPVDARAVVVNITGVAPSYSTFITAWPTGPPMPTASNLNLTPNSVVANLAVIKVGNYGRISFFNNAGNTDVVVDIVGWYN